MAESERLLRLEEVATRLGMSYTQVRMLVLYNQAIPYSKVGSRGIRVKESELEKYINKLEEKRKENGSARDKAGGDTRRPYEGRRVLPGDTGRDKPPTGV